MIVSFLKSNPFKRIIRDRNIPIIFLSISLFLFISFFQQASAQSDNTVQTKLTEQLHALSLNAPTELAYIQTSKDIYETGEDLWFKVYLLDAQFLTPSYLSRTLYLQMINENTRKVVWEEKYEIQDGFASGRAYIESNLPEGNYFLAAYTTDSFFDDTREFKSVRKIIVKKDITSKVIFPEKSGNQILAAPDKAKSDAIQFTTFPEGGELVSGIKSNVAFKAVNRNDEPVDIEGTLFEKDSSLLVFKSMYAGMGRFTFVPESDKKYLIRLSKPAIDSVYFLPEISPDGITMNLAERDKGSLYFKISQSPGSEEEDIYLRVQCRGVVYGMTSGRLNRELLIKVPLEELPQGIAEVTLFNSKLLPVAERLVYINADKKLNITAELSKEIYATRGKATLKIDVKDELGNPVVANLGLSVFDKLYQNPRDSNNILSHFYLSEQLRGRIYNPSYYFNSNNKSRDKALDLLMLTQGWRKYVWNEGSLSEFTEPKQQIIFDGINGRLFYPNSKRKIPKEQTFVMVFSPNKDSLNVLIPADSAGEFTVSPDRLKEWENDYVYLKPFGSYGSGPIYKRSDPETPEYNLHISLTDPFETINNLMKVNEVSYPIPALLKDKEKVSDKYSVENGVVRIKEVTIKGQKNRVLRGKYMGTVDSLVKYDLYLDYVCAYDVLNCPRHNRYESGTTKPVPGNWYWQIVAYNTPAEMVMRVQYTPPTFTEEQLLKMSNLWRVKAYVGNREFYKPDYDKHSEDFNIPDFRNTLLWEPSVITDENGEATISFFCSDINTDFIGRIEGVSDEGLLGSGYFKFTVRKLNTNP